MPRQPKGPRLYLRKGRIDAASGKTLPDRFFIVDGKAEVGTGCGPERMGDAERQLANYIKDKWQAPVGESDPSKVLIADVLALYGADRGKSLKSDAATMKGFVQHLLAFWGDKTLADIKRSTCQGYVAHRTKQEIRHGDTGRKVSDQTARRELEVLSSAVGHWDDEHHLARRPKVVLPEKAQTNRDALTRSEAAAILWASLGHRRVDDKWTGLKSSSGRANRAHLRRFILIGLYTGSRSGVIKQLRWTESLHDPWVDLEAGIIYRRGKNERDNRTKRRPLVKIPRRLLAHLKRWKAQDDARGYDIVVHHGGVAVGSVRTGFAGCAADAGLTATPHWLRHTCPTWLMERGVDYWEAAGYVGMTAATLEKHYGHHRPDHQSAARKALG